MDRLARNVRSCTRFPIFVGLLVAACVDGWVRERFFGLVPGPAGAAWVHGWCRTLVRAMGIEAEVSGALPVAGERGLAVVSNHLSYLDILLYSATQPFVMVSKTEVRGWPLVGWITGQAGTVYVQRADVKGGKTQTHAEVNASMKVAYASGLPVIFFPEGTTTDGSEILPFRRGLFNSVVYGDVPVRTVAVAYELAAENPGCSVAGDICFVGEQEFVPHVFKVLGMKGIKARVSFGGARVPGEDRFALAVNAREQVVELYAGLVGGEQAAGAQQGQDLLDGPVEGVGALYGQAGARG